jgi:thiol:disulfide interchange protein DsbD
MKIMTSRLVALAVVLAATLSLTARAADKKKVDWRKNLDRAMEQARKESRPVLVEFMAEWCPACKAMEDSTFSVPEVVAKMRAFVPVRIDVDRQKDVAERFKASARKYGGIGIPNVLFLAPDGRALRHRVGYYPPGPFVALLDSVLAGTAAGK